ncbi:hypothetical protein BC629DRAFT_531251 [Irpex lacteus]|nr:hypothetical protein BC629DRAFT_531251 [Irpex lacteus]
MYQHTEDYNNDASGVPPTRSSCTHEDNPAPPQQATSSRGAATVHSAQQLVLGRAVVQHGNVAQRPHPDSTYCLPSAISTGDRVSSTNRGPYHIYPYHSVDHGLFGPPYTLAAQTVHLHAPSAHQTVMFSQVNAVQSPAAGAVYYPHTHGTSLQLHVVPPAFPAAEIGLEGLHSAKNSSRPLIAPGISSTGPYIPQLPVHDALQTADNQDWTNEATPTAQPSSAQLVCGVCGRTPFKRPHELHRHMDSVHGPRKWTCDLCRKPFSRQDTMKRHKRDVHKVN